MSYEKWRDVVGYEGIYKVSNKGVVRSLDRKILRSDGVEVFKKGQILATKINDRGYVEVKLSKDGYGVYKKVHRLVSEAFIENPLNKEEVNHIDCDKTNNNVTNLEWVTHSENQVHAHREGLYKREGSNNSQSILTEEMVSDIRCKKEKGHKLNNIYEEYKNIIGIACFKSVWYGYSWKHVK